FTIHFGKTFGLYTYIYVEITFVQLYNLKYTGPNTRSRAHQYKRYHRKSRSLESLFSNTKGHISTSVPSDQIDEDNTPKQLNKNTELLGLNFLGMDNSCTISKMNNTVLSLETAIKLVSFFNGEDSADFCPYLIACNFVMSNVDNSIKPILLQAIRTKLSKKAFAITQNRDVEDWARLKHLLESNFCAKRTPGYLQLELTSKRQSQRESVHDYSTKVENLLNELCNVSTKGKSTTDATAIRTYIKEITLTTYVEGLLPHLRTVIKSRNFETLEDAMKASFEEQKIYQSYGNRSQDTGQQNIQSKVHSNPNNKDVKKITCSYCNKPGHSEDVCNKKKETNKSHRCHQCYERHRVSL
ncbi:Uncharacterized protein FWK35_00035928, partial [Aphis craccivora]